MFLFSNEGSYRYSLAEDKWGNLPRIRLDGHFNACSLGDKVFVLTLGVRIIKVLHNHGAPVSSQEINWQEIEVPVDLPIPIYNPAFAPLNSTEIVIAGGSNSRAQLVGDIVTFDTNTCESKEEVVNKLPFICTLNESANVCENTIIAIVGKGYSYHVLKYTKGDTRATIRFIF